MSRAGKSGILIPAGSDIFAGINVACVIVILFHVSRLMFVDGKALKIFSDITSGKSIVYSTLVLARNLHYIEFHHIFCLLAWKSHQPKVARRRRQARAVENSFVSFLSL